MRWLAVCALGSLVACGVLPEGTAPGATASGIDAGRGGMTTDILVRPQARPADRAAEAAPDSPAIMGSLGSTVASLGNAAEPGMWLKTPLVDRERPGTVFYAETGKTVTLTLIPIEGERTAGSRLSLSAMQALGAPLTSLPKVDVFGS